MKIENFNGDIETAIEETKKNRPNATVLTVANKTSTDFFEVTLLLSYTEGVGDVIAGELLPANSTKSWSFPIGKRCPNQAGGALFYKNSRGETKDFTLSLKKAKQGKCIAKRKWTIRPKAQVVEFVEDSLENEDIDIG